MDIGRPLSLADDQLDDLRVSARLHDIGKLEVPEAILHQPGPLDEEEFRIKKTHPVRAPNSECVEPSVQPALADHCGGVTVDCIVEMLRRARRPSSSGIG